ncbi:Zn-dependent hydrolase [Flavobacterium sp. ALD4]|uniref:Zn-dependent hydrolase n=1 Tax=Flavobacterium sp. ALD4 TaxID=2058314 RepID=UPI000C32A25C|nr:Zn-dependent hydrolase [Flavobacterium sp. ALD4]PKH67874.1 Zn-dependent hydrolase [Flavobacterium sp. ALD4]
MPYFKTSITICFFTILSFSTFSQTKNTTKKIKVNQDRIENRIFELSKFGKDLNGKGYRVSFTKGDVEGRKWFIDQMKKAGLEVTIDFAGNIIGKRQGTIDSLKTIGFGSHIDMVPDGGDYDGCLGSISGLEIMEILKENNIVTRHPLELIIFSDEEGSLLGSKALAGAFNKERLKMLSQSGLTVGEGIIAIGGKVDSISSVMRKKGDLAAFLELHIEQGGILEKENIQIGVVEGIVGIEDWEVTVEGFANHAGTTPMNLRKDALLSAAKLIVAVNEVITSHDGRQVGTVGKISAAPGAYNVVPGKVVLGLEIRDLSYDKIWELFHEIEKRAADIAQSGGTTITFKNQLLGATPALTDKSIQDKIIRATKSLNLTYKQMQSGAGHDSQDMALIAPIGMIFVPSVAGISHSPKEFSKAVDMANGANVLLQTILALDME